MDRALYHTRMGKPIILSKHQAGALIQSDVWLTLGYSFARATDDALTYSDDVIAAMIRKYPKVALICRPSFQERGPDFPIRIVCAAHPERNAWSKSFRAAAQWIKEIHQCDVVTVLACDMQPDYYQHAEKHGLSLLVVNSIIDAVPDLSHKIV